jgi:hypothetical protein
MSCEISLTCGRGPVQHHGYSRVHAVQHADTRQHCDPQGAKSWRGQRDRTCVEPGAKSELICRRRRPTYTPVRRRLRGHLSLSRSS